MDALSSKVQLLRSEFADSFLYLPLLILGFSFLYGLLTSNIGLLYLFLGQLVTVPALGFLANEKAPFASTQNIFFTLLSSAILFGLVSQGTLHFTKDMPGGQAAYTWLSVPIVLAIVKYFGDFKDLGLLDLLNPAVWMGVSGAAEGSSAICSIVPGVAKPWGNPSSWNLHITYFSGYILANAITLYNQPAPVLDESNLPADATAEQITSAISQKKGELATRVGNRKTTATIVGSIISVVCLVLLWFRFNRTQCESDWRIQLFPLILSVLVGYMSFAFAAECGVRPVDVLGLVQGMIQPIAPTVCVATSTV
jgi:hypothetical protein